MSPMEPGQQLCGVDRAPDQTRRLAAFRERHPDITITRPRENGSGEWRAVCGGDGGVAVAHRELRFLLDYLEALDRGGEQM